MALRTVKAMPTCVECSRERDAGEPGWVTVLAQARTLRIHYCPECISELVERACGVSDNGDDA
jgi:hypothetical protein